MSEADFRSDVPRANMRRAPRAWSRRSKVKNFVDVTRQLLRPALELPIERLEPALARLPPRARAATTATRTQSSLLQERSL